MLGILWLRLGFGLCCSKEWKKFMEVCLSPHKEKDLNTCVFVCLEVVCACTGHTSPAVMDDEAGAG